MTVLHYLDDFFLVGKAESGECEQALALSFSHCATFGVPIACHKTEGPTARLVFLGIELDATKGQMRLPAEKLHRLKAEIRVFGCEAGLHQEGASVSDQSAATCMLHRKAWEVFCPPYDYPVYGG